MIRKEIVLNEIKDVRNKFSKYSNIIFQDDSEFEDFLKLFGLEDLKKYIYFLFYRKIDNISYRLFFYYLEHGIKEVHIRDYELVDSSGFDHILSDASLLGKAFIQGATFGILKSKAVQDVDFNYVIIDTSEIDNVKYKKGVLSFLLKDGKKSVDIETKYIKEKENGDQFFSLLSTLVKNIAFELNKKEEEFDEAYGKIRELFEEDKIIESLTVIDKYLNEDNDDLMLHFYKALALYDNEQLLEAQKHIELSFNLLEERVGNFENSEEWSDEVASFYAELRELNSIINYGLKNYEKALWEINGAYFLTKDTSNKADYKETREEVLEGFMENISDLDFHKRRLIYIETDLPTFKPDTILPLRMDDLKSFVFPPSHPIKGELYVGHPLQPNYYYPLEDYEQLLFESQFVELNHLLQCLGATEIKSEHIKGAFEFNESESKQSEKSNANFNQKAEGGNKLTSANAERKFERKDSKENKEFYKNKSEVGKRMMSVQKFSPKKTPYIPEDLVWYKHNETWRKIAQQRLQGELDYYEMVVSSKNVIVINEREKNKINSDYKLLISGGYKNAVVNSKASKESEKHAESKNDITSALTKENTNEWKLIVSFAPLDQFTNGYTLTDDESETQKLKTNELKYIEDIEFALEDDGVIDDNERRMLERNQSRYEISDERAKELEAKVLSKNEHSDEELEFIEEVNFILDHDGDIDDGDRRILLRLATRLSITEQRAKELEEGVLRSRETSPEFTEQEQQYIEELNFCLEDGPNISRGGRRLLDKTMKSLGISEERAREIEEIIQAKLCDPENG